MVSDFIHQFTSGKLAHTVLLLHGTGGDENDLLPVGRALAPGASFLSPRGKVLEHGAPRFFSRSAPGVFDQAEIRERATELAAWIQASAVRYQFDPAKVYALGYSNGANIAAAIMLLHPHVISGAFLLRPMPVIEIDEPPDLQGAPVMISAGADDPYGQGGATEQLAKLLSGAGAKVDVVIQNSGHDLTPADFNLGKQWFASLPQEPR